MKKIVLIAIIALIAFGGLSGCYGGNVRYGGNGGNYRYGNQSYGSPRYGNSQQLSGEALLQQFLRGMLPQHQKRCKYSEVGGWLDEYGRYHKTYELQCW